MNAPAPFTTGSRQTYADGVREALGCLKVVACSSHNLDSPLDAVVCPLSKMDIVFHVERHMRDLLGAIAMGAEFPHAD